MDTRQQFDYARMLIEQKRYDEARQLLMTINHPAATDWLQKMEAEIAAESGGRKRQTDTGSMRPMQTPSLSYTPAAPMGRMPVNGPVVDERRLRGLKTRRTIFWILTTISLMYLCYGVTGTSAAVDSVVSQSTATTEAEQAGTAIGVAIGGGLGLAFFLCTGLPFFFIFALLAWRNGSGLRTERRHLEMLAVTGSR